MVGMHAACLEFERCLLCIGITMQVMELNLLHRMVLRLPVASVPLECLWSTALWTPAAQRCALLDGPV